MQTARITLKDIAKRLNVSHATVSLALRNSNRISSQRKDQVRALAKELGYQPDPMLSSLVAYRHRLPTSTFRGVIAWICRARHIALSNPVSGENLYWSGAFNAAARFGFQLEKFIWNEEFSVSRMHQILYTRGVQGLLVPSPCFRKDAEDFPWEDFSVIRLGTSTPHPTAHIVSCDYMQSTYLATSKMYLKGYRRIGFITSGRIAPQIRNHYVVGYETALGMLAPESPDRLLQLPDNKGHAQFQLQHWLQACRPDAILTSEPGLPHLLHALGVRVPKDIALASTDTIAIPSIDAGIVASFEEAGRISAEMMTSILSQKSILPQQILVASAWREGSSLPGR